MKKIRKMIMLMLTTLLFTAAFRFNIMAEETDSEDYTYTVNEDDTVTIKRYIGNDTELIIPSTINGKKVTAIGSYAFSGCNITSIEIPDGVTEIKSYAFRECKDLISVVIPESVKKIEGTVFYKCDKLTTAGSLESSCNIRFGWTDTIPDNAFKGSEIVEITIPDGITKINYHAFYACINLTNVVIPESVVEIDRDAFNHCNKLTTAGPLESSCNIRFGWTEAIPSNAFWGSDLQEVTIPDGVTHIGDHAFVGCFNLTKVSIPNSVTCIKDFAFCSCPELTDIVIPGSVTEIGASAFSHCSNLNSIVLSKNLKTIGENAFWESGICSIVIPEGVTDIGDKAFMSCNRLSSVTLPNSLTYIADNLFRSCVSLHELTLPDSITSIGDTAFTECIRLSLTVPSSVTKISPSATAGITDLILYGESDSAIEAYAIKNDYTFVALDEDHTGEMYDDGFAEKNGRLYWYENGVKQGVKYNEDGYIDLSYRGKEIYDPESDCWYWLDCVRDGAVAVSKDVYQESQADDDGSIGKWVRYDENGRMIKGWQESPSTNQKFYFDPIYGTMAKGIVAIDGVNYEFDRVSGALIKEVDIVEIVDTYSDKNGYGWKIEDGKPYWYENGVKQGVKYNEDGSIDLTYRGKEIYDPYTKAWYWLDNVHGGTIAVSKDVYQESQADDDGNIGKWVRYDAYGHMVKGWDSNENGKYYFDPIYGAMVKGWFNGLYFDEITGIFWEE